MKTSNLTKTALAVVVASQLLSAEAFAGLKFKETLFTGKKEAIQDPYYMIKSTKVEELSEEDALEFINDSTLGLSVINLNIPAIPPRPVDEKAVVTPGAKVVASTTEGTGPKVTATGVLDGVIMVLDKLIAIGQKVIPTIEKGKAVVTNNPMAAVSVLPRLDTKDLVVHDMGNWSIPVTKHYKISYKNGFGSEIVTFIYSITFQYGGQHEGKGKYLTGIRAAARNITISWGFDLDASSQLIAISNVGSTANVVAGATIEISYTVKNWTRQITTNEAFFISGDGKLYKLD